MIFGCSHRVHKKGTSPEVSLKAALDQAQMSYLKGCVEAFKEAGYPPTFPYCKEKALQHKAEIQSIIDDSIEGWPKD